MSTEYIKEIKDTYPRAFKYYQEYILEKYTLESPEKLHFDLLLGTFVAFFDSINSDIQFYSTDRDVLKQSVLDAFETYEEYLFLDS